MNQRVKDFFMGLWILTVAFGTIGVLMYFTATVPYWLVIPVGILLWSLCEQLGKDWREKDY